MGGRAWRIYLAGGLAAVALYLLLPLEGLWSNLAYDLIGLSSVAAILIAARRHRPARPLLWWCFAVGQLLFVIGDVLYEVIDLVLHQSPFPSVADGFYLAGYPVLATGLLILIRGRISGRDRAGLIDAAIIATGLGLLSWTFLMKPIAADIGYAVLNLVSSYEGGLIDAGCCCPMSSGGRPHCTPPCGRCPRSPPTGPRGSPHRRLALLATTSLMAPAVLAGKACGTSQSTWPRSSLGRWYCSCWSCYGWPDWWPRSRIRPPNWPPWPTTTG
jgi:hypothetical protein